VESVSLRAIFANQDLELPILELNMSIRSLIIALVLAGLAFPATTEIGFAQVLTPPAPLENQAPVKVQFKGIVTQQKKYSFDVKTEDRDYQVKLAPGATLILRLNKPTYDFSNRIVKVVRVAPGGNEQAASDSDAEPGRVSYPLPETLFVEAKFEHVRQMQRIMQARVKRINNYSLTEKDPGAGLPTETTLRIGGQLLPADDPAVAKLKVDAEEFAVMLGQRGATLSGFNILDLPADSTEVFVWGFMGDDDVVSAERIEFQPIVVRHQQ
jgi:hypothetical protein